MPPAADQNGRLTQSEQLTERNSWSRERRREGEMELNAGKVAVVTGAASGIGFALAQRFAMSGLDVVLADVEETALRAAAESVQKLGVESLAVRTDVSDEDSVRALAAAAVERFGSVHVVCNNAGVESIADPWFGPVTSWQWVLGVNLWGVIHGVRAFLPILAEQGHGHIVNTASMAGLIPGASAPYDAAKHAVVAISEDLYNAMKIMRIDVGVSVLCPGLVRTQLLDANRNWPASLGQVPPAAASYAALEPHVRRAVEGGMAPAAVAGLVAEAVVSGRFWILTHPDFTETALRRWQSIAAGEDPRRIGVVPDSHRADRPVEP
jgi:NAD(P)-dependent dehydrogenase (short-subunit alcohol dehydrogenase family)